MKKVFMFAAVAAMIVADVACGNNNTKREKAEEATENCCEETKSVEEATKDLGKAVENAANETVEKAKDATTEAIDKAAEAAKEAVKNN